MQKIISHQAGKKSGFTLIELSIVLVIIGLIVGGVLVGQDLIKAAELRAGVAQLEKYDTAVNTFRSKYNGLPGDMLNSANFGFTAVAAADGNGVLNRSADARINQESAAFFRHLSLSSLIPDTITVNVFTAADAGLDTVETLPASKMGRGLRVAAYGDDGINYYGLSQIVLADGVVTITSGSEMANIDAFGFDTKLDDGNPSTGKVIAITDLETADAGNAGASATHCVDTTGDNLYQTSTAAIAAVTYCSLRVRASF